MNYFKTRNKSTVLLHLTEPTTGVNVYRNGALYFFRRLKGSEKKIKFNVCHAGNYTIDANCDVELLPFSISATLNQLPGLPPYERNKDKTIDEILCNVQIKAGTFSNTPARNWVKRGVIETGVSFENLMDAFKYFILLHEVGHFYYSDETACDLFALHHFLASGYNESTAFYALAELLDARKPEHVERITNLFKSITQ